MIRGKRINGNLAIILLNIIFDSLVPTGFYLNLSANTGLAAFTYRFTVDSILGGGTYRIGFARQGHSAGMETGYIRRIPSARCRANAN